MPPLLYVALAIVVTALLHTWPTFALDCDSGWTYRFGRCYRVYVISASPNSARAQCESEDGMLASVNNQDEHNFLIWLRSAAGHTGHILIGGRDEKVDGVWLWGDGKPGVFMPWADGEPGSAEACVMFLYEGGSTNRRNRLADIYCTDPYAAYVCQKPANTPTPVKLTSFKLRVKGKKSVKTPLVSLPATSLLECVTLCINQDGCLSVNLCSGGTVCDVLDADLVDGVVSDAGCDVWYMVVQYLE